MNDTKRECASYDAGPSSTGESTGASAGNNWRACWCVVIDDDDDTISVVHEDSGFSFIPTAQLMCHALDICWRLNRIYARDAVR